ncbi:MAG: 3-methyl-2-oxobutanoate dehydrogenase subunit VorB [Anaerolineae bacterium]|nr:3-methyl-2-oxobutanoate dehydrogenase subunit VorB [Anaerolineae bacterium]MDW8068938.1 3-methyl-2-oxobutanoate dehydrogenase subunit VorB [Anaerolineae bacterium]
MARELWEGNMAIAEAAVRAGLEAFFGYPITPQTEILEYLSRRLPELGRVFLQAESEVASINMVYGAACAGARVMTSSSSPGISLMQEGFSYIACSEVPAVVVNLMRGGPGLGNVAPSQGDYFQAVKMAGHGDFHPIVLAPGSIQEAIDLTILAFDLADRYRTLAMIVADGSLGQMMEPAEMPPMRPVRPPGERPPWALTGARGRLPNVITSLYLAEEDLEQVNLRLQAKLRRIAANEVRWKEYATDDAELLIVAFGTVGRICQTVVREARAKGLKAGLLRPVTLWPFPSTRIAELAARVRGMLVVEMNAGQMLEDVRLAVEARCPVRFYGRLGGMIPLPDEILPQLEAMDAEV